MYQLTCPCPTCSSVARAGGGGAIGVIALPIGLESMQNSMFLAVLRLIFDLKTKIALPPNEIGVKAGEDREMIMTSRNGVSAH